MFTPKTSHTFPVMLVLLAILVAACNPSLTQKHTVIDDGFPLSEKWSFTSNVPIYSLATSDNWIAIGQDTGITALSTTSGQFLWSLDFPLNINSPLFLSDGYLVVAEESQIDVIDKSGNLVSKVDIALQGEVEQILAVYSDYIFIRRFPSWNLEVYNMWTGEKVWELVVHRANVTINYDPATEIVYITTTGFIGAYEIANGNEIWRVSEVTRSGVLDSGTLYFSTEISSTSTFISAVTVQNLDQIWGFDVTLDNRAVYNMTIIDDMLIASTDYGFIALNKIDGHKLWESETNEYFWGKVVTINNNFYGRGTDTRIIYAISPDNGRYLGYLRLGKPSQLISTFHKEYDIVYESENLLIFPFQSTVFAYQEK